MNAARLEVRICAAVQKAVASGAPGMARNPVVRGSWQDAWRASRGPELKPVGVTIDVTVAPGSFERFGVNKAAFDCTISATFENASKLAADTTVVPTCGAISRMLFGWQMDGSALADDLGFDGVRPFAIVATGGVAPTYDKTADEWSAAFRFKVSAVVTAE